MWPHRSGLVVIWIERAMVSRKRADAPTAPHVLAHQPFYHARGMFRCDDAGPKTLSNIGRHRQYFFLLSVQSECIKAGPLVPESLVEFLEQHGRLFAQGVCTSFVVQFVVDLGHA